jgi:post-segregation antitoxin (ccd killing protein)
MPGLNAGDVRAMRVNVYVPDELYDRAKRLRQWLNFSKIFQRALEKEIRLVESLSEMSKGNMERAGQEHDEKLRRIEDSSAPAEEEDAHGPSGKAK